MNPASGPVPVTTVPAASISATTGTRATERTRRSARTSRVAGPSPSAQRDHSATASARIELDSRKWSETAAGLRSVSTTIPPSRAWATTPRGWAAASQTMTRRRVPAGRNRQAVTMTSTATTMSTNVSIRLVNSM